MMKTIPNEEKGIFITKILQIENKHGMCVNLTV